MPNGNKTKQRRRTRRKKEVTKIAKSITEAVNRSTAPKKRRNRVRRRNPPLKPTNKMQFQKDGLLVKAGKMLGAVTNIPWMRPILERGVDLITTLSTAASAETVPGIVGTVSGPGELLFRREIAPRAFGATRVNKLSELYQRFIFSRLIINYVPAANRTQSGQLIAFFDTDPQDSVPTGIAGLNYAKAHGGVLFQISEPANIAMPIIKDRTYYTSYEDVDEDERFKVQAVFYVLAVTALPASTALGSFSVDYSIKFDLPQMEVNAPGQAGFSTVYRNGSAIATESGTYHFFTSDSSANDGFVNISQLTKVDGGFPDMPFIENGNFVGISLVPNSYYAFAVCIKLGAADTITWSDPTAGNSFQPAQTTSTITISSVRDFSAGNIAYHFLFVNFTTSSTLKDGVDFNPFLQLTTGGGTVSASDMIIHFDRVHKDSFSGGKVHQHFLRLEDKILELEKKLSEKDRDTYVLPDYTEKPIKKTPRK